LLADFAVITVCYDVPLTNVSVAEEALSLAPEDRAKLARLLIQSLGGDEQTDEAIKAELASRLEALTSGLDAGLSFEEIFKSSS
jgi:putative addiction module component (TIGR02574 family)